MSFNLAIAKTFKVSVRFDTSPTTSMHKSLDVQGAYPPVVGDRVLDDGRMWTIISVIAVVGPGFVEAQ